MLQLIHPNWLVATTAIVCGVVLGIALALSDWKSKFTVGSIVTTISSAIASITAEKVKALKDFLASTTLLPPMLCGFDIAIVTFLFTLITGALLVFVVKYLPAKRAGDPEAFVRAVRSGVAVFGSGLHRYITAPPDLAARNKIRALEKHRDIICLISKTLAREVAEPLHSQQHFDDSVSAIGRLLLQTAFGDGPDLQHFRMAFFERQGDRIEYRIAINNGDWTAHSMKGFTVKGSFIGEAVRLDRPLVYPRDKKWGVAFSKRSKVRYKSFVALPVPCGRGAEENVGAITVDYTGTDDVFAELRIEELFALTQLIHSFYLLNVRGGPDVKEQCAS
jgi:hypothetical protein